MAEKETLYKVFAGCFYILDENGKVVENHKDKALFKNTYGLAFFINSATKGRGYVLYFARDNSGWNFRTTFPVGKIIETDNKICLKTRYNTFVWDDSNLPENKLIEELYEWVSKNGETYIPGLIKYPGIKEYFERGHHFER